MQVQGPAQKKQSQKTKHNDMFVELKFKIIKLLTKLKFSYFYHEVGISEKNYIFFKNEIQANFIKTFLSLRECNKFIILSKIEFLAHFIKKCFIFS